MHFYLFIFTFSYKVYSLVRISRTIFAPTIYNVTLCNATLATVQYAGNHDGCAWHK